MTRQYTDLLDELGRLAREKAVAEQAFRKEAALRAEELRQERAFAYRRLNLLRAVAAGVGGAGDETEALAAGRRILMREAAWTGALTEAREEVARQFEPVSLAVWQAVRAEPEEGAARDDDDDAQPDAGAALAAFEAWYEDARGGAFLGLMEREVLELPLVEV